jgi:hypothetical protein
MGVEYKHGNGVIRLVNQDMTKYQSDAVTVSVAYNFEPVSDRLKDIIEKDPAIILPEGDPEINGAYLINAGSWNSKYIFLATPFGFNPEAGVYSSSTNIKETTRNVLNLACEQGLKSVGVPPYGSAQGMTLDWSVPVILDEFENHLEQETSLERLALVLLKPSDFNKTKEIYHQRMQSR